MLTNHSVLIIGGGSGLGRGVARRFHQHGATLTIFEVSSQKIESLKEEFGDSVVIVQGDCTKSADLLRCRDEIVQKRGKLDALLCCQGIFDANVSLKDVPIEAVDALFDEIFHINVKGNLLAARVFCGLLEESQGAIVMTSSNAAYAADGGGAAYSATKGAVNSLVHQLAFEFAPNIRVNAVAPGGIGGSELRGPASLHLDGFKLSDIPKEAMAAKSREIGLIQEVPMAEDYAHLFMFLASHENRVMTGQTILAEQGALNRRLLSEKKN